MTTGTQPASSLLLHNFIRLLRASGVQVRTGRAPERMPRCADLAFFTTLLTDILRASPRHVIIEASATRISVYDDRVSGSGLEIDAETTPHLEARRAEVELDGGTLEWSIDGEWLRVELTSY